MAIGVLVLGEPGTGKTFSIRNLTPDEVEILSVVKPILPFRGKYSIKKTPSGDAVIRAMKATKKKVIVVDDFQYILGVPMLKRIGEKGWDKFNEIQQPYADVLDTLKDLPDDTIVFFNSHTTTDDSGRTQIKTIGKALDKYISIEGLFMIVLGTSVVDGKYYFITQNNGANTLKSPDGMFPSLAIPNDMQYVVDKIRNYYYMDGAKTDEEMAAEDEEHTVADEDLKKKRGRRSRGNNVAEVDTGTGTITGATMEELKQEEAPAEEPKARTRKKRTVTPAEMAPVHMYVRLSDGSVKMLKEGEAVPEGAAVISQEEFDRELLNGNGQVETRRRRKKEAQAAAEEPAAETETPEEVPFDEIEQHPELIPDMPEPAPRVSRRRRRG